MALFVLYAFTYAPQDKWVVPANFKSMKNPVAKSGESLEIGEELYMQHCKSCHGKYGEGDGPKADGLETFPGDFTSDEFQDQSDGEIFYKTKHGRDEITELISRLKDDLLAGGFILSTCNRTELFGIQKDGFVVYNLAEKHLGAYGASIKQGLSSKSSLKLEVSRGRFKELGADEISTSLKFLVIAGFTL